jgi:uncharacterized protein (TIGR03067 family)
MNWLPAFALALTVAAPAKEEPKKAETPSIVGEWTCIKFVGDGLERTELDELKQIGFEFTADGKYRGRFGDEKFAGTYTTDPAKEPAEIDLKREGKDMKGLGLYKIEKETLTLCFAEGKRGRPEKLASPAGTRIMLMTFTRVEKKKD